VGDPEDLVFEPLDVLGLLHELVLGNEERKERLLVIPVEEVTQAVVHELADPESIGVPDIQSLDRVADVHDPGTPEDIVKPCGKD
jgi:hypothetical protein